MKWKKKKHVTLSCVCVQVANTWSVRAHHAYVVESSAVHVASIAYLSVAVAVVEVVVEHT